MLLSLIIFIAIWIHESKDEKYQNVTYTFITILGYLLIIGLINNFKTVPIGYDERIYFIGIVWFYILSHFGRRWLQK